ncbi:MAG: phosphotransferase family protein [Nocardioidaceae bacterium]
MPFVKRRPLADPGSIPAVLGMFEAEVRFYREIAPVLGVRVPECFQAESSAAGHVLVLEDLSSWDSGADPVRAAAVLSSMHARWQGRAYERWPWLRSGGAGTDLVADLFDTSWPALESRPDCPAPVGHLGRRLFGRVREAEAAGEVAGPKTLVHGDASLHNMRTSADAEIALLDWEDVSYAPAATDLTWLVVSSVEPGRWDEVVDGYGEARGFVETLPAMAVQGLLSFADTTIGSDQAIGWTVRLEEVQRRLA